MKIALFFLFLIGFYFCKLITRNFGRKSMPESNIFFTTKILLSVFHIFAVSVLKKYLLYVCLTLNFFGSHFVHGGVILLLMLQCFTFLCLNVLFAKSTFKTIHFWSKKGRIKHKDQFSGFWLSLL